MFVAPFQLDIVQAKPLQKVDGDRMLFLSLVQFP
jgi:hypothetical protein